MILEQETRTLGTNDEGTESNLPAGWVWTNVGGLFNILSGGTPSTSIEDYWNGSIPWITSADIIDLKVIKPRKCINQEAIKNSATKLVPKGSIIVVTRVGLGKIALTVDDICFSQDCQGLISKNNHIYQDYILYYLSEAVKIFKYENRGTTIAGVTKKQLSELSIPLPPLPEQHRIVAKIEELFTKLDAGFEALKKVKAQVKRYRQAVLKYAFEGKLTEEWRGAHKDKLEPASVLLERIKEERKKNAKGKSKEIPPIDTSGLPELPEGWVWLLIGEIFSVCIGATPSRKRLDYWNGDISWVSSSEVNFCEIFKTKETITKQGFENSSTELHPQGTVLLGMIGEGKTRGQAAILQIEACNSQNSAAIRVSDVGLPPKYLYYYLVKEYEQTRKMGSGNNQPALNKLRVQMINFPLSSQLEQHKIVEEIERHFSIAYEVEKMVDQSLKQADRLRQSILKRAFEGKLVPQDPNDAPAEKLMERIREQRRGAQETSPKLSKKRNKSIS